MNYLGKDEWGNSVGIQIVRVARPNGTITRLQRSKLVIRHQTLPSPDRVLKKSAFDLMTDPRFLRPANPTRIGIINNIGGLTDLGANGSGFDPGSSLPGALVPLALDPGSSLRSVRGDNRGVLTRRPPLNCHPRDWFRKPVCRGSFADRLALDIRGMHFGALRGEGVNGGAGDAARRGGR